MVPPTSALAFFDEPKVVSIRKLDLLRAYLTPWTYKLGSGWRHIWVVDGFAGAGAYRPDGGGHVQPGSPVIAARWAAAQAKARGHPLLRCINTEADPACFAELERNLEPWREVVTNFSGEFGSLLDGILEAVGRDPVFYFLDPFGVNGIEMKVVERILERGGRHSELLIHFSERSFKRMAGHASERERRRVGERVAESKLARLDALMGTKLWRPWWSGDPNPNVAFNKTIELYLAQLRERGFRFAHQIRMRDTFDARPRYRLIFATNSPHGVGLMSDIACGYERGLEEEQLAGKITLFAEPEARQRAAELQDLVHRAGIELGGRASGQDVEHHLVPAKFGVYRRSEFARAIRQLVTEGRIDRRNSKGIDDREPLRFRESAQGALSLADLGPA